MSAPFSFNRLGPFYRLQRRLGLLSDADLASARRALLFIALSWIPALLLAALQGVALNDNHERALLFDFSVYAFVIAIVAFLLMEQTSDQRMAWLVGQFTAFGIVPETSRERFVQVRRAMERRTASGPAEGAILVVAYLLAFAWIARNAARVDGGTWAAQMQGGSLTLTLAGWWALLVALPLFWFLLGRWLWRFVTWGMLLRDIARCDLRLVATHPDRCGGIAFIGQYPKSYTLFVFAISSVVAAGVLKHVVYAGASLMTFKFALIGLVVFLCRRLRPAAAGLLAGAEGAQAPGPEPLRRAGEPAQPGFRGKVDRRSGRRSGRRPARLARRVVARRPCRGLRTRQEHAHRCR